MLLNFNVYSKSLKNIDLKYVRIINTINPHSYCISRKDKDFEAALQASDVLLPDGIGIVWAMKILKGKSIKKIAGFDLFQFLMHHLNATNGSCFFLGASQSTLDAIHRKIALDFPNVKVNSYSPPYKAVFSEGESKEMCKQVNAVKPNVLFVGMTAPKQEKWVYEFKTNLDTNIICSIGAVFDFYAGNVKRPSQFWIKLGLEWLPRLIREPKRLWRRNLISSPLFLWYLFLEKIK